MLTRLILSRDEMQPSWDAKVEAFFMLQCHPVTAGVGTCPLRSC